MIKQKRKEIIIIVPLLLFVSVLFSQDCNIISKANDIIPDGLCAPVTVSWEVTYRGVNDAGTPVEIQYDWDDGTIDVIAATNTNIPLQEWQATAIHIYPPGGSQCTYRPTATLMVNGVLCTSSVQEQVVTVWDTDDENGGHMAIDPDVFPICVGNDGCTFFTDVSLFNCVPPVENDNPNTPTRWTQWVYGTSYTINNVTVDGVVQSYPYYGAVVPLPGPVTGPGAPNNVSLECCAPATALVGQFFEVTLRNWNYCNPYDDPSIPGPPTDPVNGDYPPVETTAIILIVPYPDATITPLGPFCENDPSVNFSAATPGGTWSGTGITNANNGTFNPSVAGPGVHTISYSVTDANGCTGTDTFDVTVYAIPDPDILPGPNSEVCPGDALILDGNPTPGDGAIISHQWTGNTGPLNFTNIQAPTFLTSSQGVYNMTYTVTDDNGCSASENVSVSVNPVSANIIPDPAETCVGEAFALNGNPSGGTGNYVTHIWTGDISYLNNSAIQNPVFTGPVAGVYNLTYSVTDDNGCNDSDNISITVYDNPVSFAGPDSGLCGNTIDLFAVPSLGTGTWTQASGPGISTFSNVNDALSNVTVDQYGSYEFVWTEVYGAGCTDKDTVMITFYEQPVSNAGADDSICGSNYVLNATPSSGTGTWSEVSGPGFPVFSDVNSPNSQVTVNMYGSYQFMWKENNNGCVDSSVVTINFDLVPVPEFYPDDTSGCPPLSIQFVNNTTAGVSYEWDFGDGNSSTDVNPVHTYYNAGSTDMVYTISLVAESMYGCLDSIEHQLTVHPVPDADYTSDAVPQCSPSLVHFTNNSTGSVLHVWDYGDGTPHDTTDNPSHLFVNNSFLIQYYEVNLLAVSSFGCIDTFTQFVTVYPNHHNNFTVNPDTSCHPANVQFNADPGGSVYFWDFGDGYTLTATNIITHNYTNTSLSDTTYFVNLITTSSFGCLDTSVKPVVIYPKPTADFTLSQFTGCSPVNVQLFNNSSGASQYFWNFDDGSSSASSDDTLNHLYINPYNTPITFYPILTVENTYGCTDSIKLQILVNPEVEADFISDMSGCANLSVSFDNQSSGATSYSWSFGDGMYSSVSEPVHNFINTTQLVDTFQVQMIASSIYGCSDTVNREIVVYPSPIASFSLNNSSGCSPFNAQISNNSIGAATHFWNYGDGNSEYNVNLSFSHQYTNIQSNPVNYTLELITENNYGCKDSVSQQLTVYPSVQVHFICDTLGCHPYTVSFINQTMGAQTYMWNFGDGTTSTSVGPVHTFTNTNYNPVQYSVNMTATSSYGCTATQTQDITVYPTPVAAFVVNPQTQQFNGDSNLVSIVNNSTPGTWSYLWNFGDGGTSTVMNPNHYYTNYGVYDIVLIVYSAYCSDTITQSIEITQPPPIAAFSGTGVGCAPLTIEFENNSLFADDYLWDFGDNKTSTDYSPTHTYTIPGNYAVTLIVSNDFGIDTVSMSGIEVYQNPTAYFNASPKLVNIGDPVSVNNQSQNADYYTWDYESDGTVDSNTENPVIYYTKEGSYYITLVVRTIHFCLDTFIMPEAVIVSNLGEIEFPNAFSPNPSGPNGGNWGGVYNENTNDIFHPLYKGVSEYKLMIFNRWGEMIFESTNPDIGWDGYYRGKLCKQDVYVWKVVGKYVNGQDFIEAGDVTLLH